MAYLVIEIFDDLSFFSEKGKGKTKEQGKKQNLENIAFGKRIHNTGWNDIHQEIRCGKRFGARCVGGQHRCI